MQRWQFEGVRGLGRCATGFRTSRATIGVRGLWRIFKRDDLIFN